MYCVSSDCQNGTVEELNELLAKVAEFAGSVHCIGWLTGRHTGWSTGWSTGWFLKSGNDSDDGFVTAEVWLEPIEMAPSMNHDASIGYPSTLGSSHSKACLWDGM